MSADPTSLCENGTGGYNVPTGNTALDSFSQTSSNDPTGGLGPCATLLGSTNQVYQSDRDYNDPLGMNAQGQMAPSGGPEMRSAIYGDISGAQPQMQANTNEQEAALQKAAAQPGYANADTLANKEITGGFLNGSPQLNNLLSTTRASGESMLARQMANDQNLANVQRTGILTGANRQIGDQNAQIGEQYALSGMPMSTAAQEAQGNNAALQNDNANQAVAALDAQNNASLANLQGQTNESLNNTEAQTRYQDYSGERANQNNAVNTLNEATGAPVNYLSQTNAAQLSPLSSIAQIVQGLSGGATTSYRPQDIVNDPGAIQSIGKTVSSL